MGTNGGKGRRDTADSSGIGRRPHRGSSNEGARSSWAAARKKELDKAKALIVDGSSTVAGDVNKKRRHGQVLRVLGHRGSTWTCLVANRHGRRKKGWARSPRRVGGRGGNFEQP